MDKLTDFKPLERVLLPDLGPIDASGLVLVVGPNSSGKSQLLQDIYYRLTGQPRKLVVASGIDLTRPPLKPLIDLLEKEQIISSVYDDGGTRSFRPLTMFLGTGQAVGQINLGQAESWHQQIPEKLSDFKRPVEFLSFFGRLLVTGLFLDRRLIAANQVGLIDFENQPPQADLHALFVDDNAKKALFDEIRETFGKAVWPDMSRGNALVLKVSDRGVLPSEAERNSFRAMAKYRSIESEGDGLKSYIATCMTLILGRRPVCVIDEPEMCLHPPQAYSLGRFIGSNACSTDTVTFVATHSSNILRGVVLTAPKVQIVRLTRLAGEFHAHLLSAEDLAAVLQKPSVRAETILDGIFAQAVVVVEAGGDRHVYQAAWNALADELHIEVHFAAVGGVGGIPDTCAFYRSLSIPVAVIADLDIINDLKRLVSTLETLTSDAAILAKARTQAIAVLNALRALNPQIGSAELQVELQAISALPTDWSVGDDHAIRRSLSSLAGKLDRLRRMKQGGVAALPDPLRMLFKELIETLASVGLFLVPVGELEGWLADKPIQSPRSKKWAWANEAAELLRKLEPETGDIWAFIRRISAYLQTALG